MLGLESERRLLALLDAIKEGELSQERRRQRLCSIRDFAPYSAFMRMDRDVNENITSVELLNFMRDNREYTISHLDCMDILKYFDSDEDGYLSFHDFQSMFLPCEDNILRELTMKRPYFRVGRFDYLPANMESELSGLLYSEISLLRKLRNLKEDLAYRYDFSNVSAFRTIDRYNEGFITVSSIRQFFRNNGIYLSEKEALAIVRRIDTDGDAKIGYSEFADFMNYHIPNVERSHNDWRSSSQYRPTQTEIMASSTSPLRPANKKRAQTSEKKKRTQVSFFDSHNVTPVKKSNNNDTAMGMSDFKTAEKSYTSSSPMSHSHGKSYRQIKIEDDTVRVLKEFTKLERELEMAKQNLALKPDFNLFDAFKIFDVRDMGSVDHIDMKEGLVSIGIFATNDEINLFIKRYDQDKNGKLRFSEFCNALLPLDPYYSTVLNRRTSNNVRTHYRDDCFSYSTRLELKEFFRTQFQVERATEHSRHTLNSDPYYDIYEAFKACDINEDGIVTKNEIRGLLEKSGFYASEMEMQTLMVKLDKDRDGKVALYEFMDEMKPKSYAY